MINVSVKTPNVWIRPCFTGCDTSAVAATFGAELITEQAPFDSLHQSSSDRSADGLFPSESIADDEFKHGRKFSYIEKNDTQCQRNISESHYGNNNTTHFCDSLNTSKDDEDGQDG